MKGRDGEDGNLPTTRAVGEDVGHPEGAATDEEERR
jgi:hypothetical protein